jgi:hypothetical protein
MKTDRNYPNALLISPKHLLLTVLGFFMVQIGSVYSQSGTIFHYGNTRYYLVNHLSDTNLKGTSKSFREGLIAARYFDTRLKGDSINLVIGDTTITFFQKKKQKTQKEKEIFPYKSRPFINNNYTVYKLKLYQITDTCLVAKAQVRITDGGKKTSEKQKIVMPLKEIEGVYLGSGKKLRYFQYVVITIVAFPTYILFLHSAHNE